MNTQLLMDRKSFVRITGSVYTPREIACELISLVRENHPEKLRNIIEPSVGDGVFLNAMISMLIGNQYTAIDIDNGVIEKLKQDNNAKEIMYVTDDFINYVSNLLNQDFNKFDLVIGNPPFIRKHNFSNGFKDTLKNFSEITNYPLSYLKNSWVAFLIAASRICTDTGIVAFVLPYELLTVDYGNKILHFIQFEFDCVDIYVSRNKAFPLLEQDAVLFFGQKKSTGRKGLYLNHIQKMSDLREPEQYKLNFSNPDLYGIELNAFLLPLATIKLIRNIYLNCHRIEDFAGSAPGIVTAANDFFILNTKQVEELGLEKYVIPILKKGSFISSRISFTDEDFIELEKKEPCYLLSIKGDFEDLDANVQSYIKSGEERELHLRYKCKNRKNWYEVPLVPTESGFFFKRSHAFPRICLNQAGVYLTDTAYGIKLKDGVSSKGIVYSFYNSLTMLFSEIKGRFYGGGVLELSPKEFRSLPMVYFEPSDKEFSIFKKLYNQADGNIEMVLDHGDALIKKALNLSDQQMLEIRQAWKLLRAHRMRHGGKEI